MQEQYNLHPSPDTEEADPFRVHVTFFADFAAKTLTTESLTLEHLTERILNASARKKAALPWLKLAIFGKKTTAKGSLRHDANIERITGIEIDYDHEKIGFGDAVKAIETAGINAIIYTSPSHQPNKPRWRILAPTSQACPPTSRLVLMKRLNGCLKVTLNDDEVASTESFALSQAFFYGWTNDNADRDHRAAIVHGDFIDLRNDLAAHEANGSPRKTDDKPGAPTGDQPPQDDEARGFEAILSTIGDGSGLKGFNDPLSRAAASYVAMHRGHAFDKEKLKTLLRDAINKAPKGPARSQDDIFRYLSDHYLDGIITSAERKFATQGPITLADFVSVMANGSYLFIPTRELWPPKSVNACIAPILKKKKDGSPLISKKTNQPIFISATDWLDQHQRVEQLSWVPGHPEIITDKLVADGGWIERHGVSVFNLYRAPTIVINDLPNVADIRPWFDHLTTIYPEDWAHLVKWWAHRVQRPQQKINHAIVLGGLQGIGKDTLVEPVKTAVGPWNFSEVSPQQLLGRFNGFLKSVILRISEARDLGDVNRYAFYEHLKSFIAAPPDVLRVDEKYLREHAIINVVGVILTTNYKSGGIYLPPDDRRHFVAWSSLTKENFDLTYFARLWDWYCGGGIERVVAYLHTVDLSDFNPKAPPPKTPAFWDIVDSNRAPEDAELADVLDRMGNPDATTLLEVAHETTDAAFAEWLKDRKNRRAIPHRFEQAGYVPVRNDAADDGLWKLKGRRVVIYAKAALSVADQFRAARGLA